MAQKILMIRNTETDMAGKLQDRQPLHLNTWNVKKQGLFDLLKLFSSRKFNYLNFIQISIKLLIILFFKKQYIISISKYW